MRKKSLANPYLSELCMELGMLFEAGIAPADGVLMLLDDETDPDAKVLLKGLLEVLEKGMPLSSALHESTLFPVYMVKMLEVGEKTGRVTETLKALSAHYDRQERLAVSIKNAITYPVVLLVMMVIVVLILIIKVLPVFNEVFERLGSQMSPLAARLMQFGSWLGNASTAIASIAGIALIVAMTAWIVPPVRLFLSKRFNSIFGHRRIFGDIAASRYVSVLALAIASGLDTEESLDLASGVGGGSEALDKRHGKCIELFRSGGSLAESLFQSKIITARNSRLLSMGFRSGNSEKAMAEIAERSNRSVSDGIDLLISRIEPALIIITSVIVGVILMSVMLPLMGIMTSIG